MFMSRISSNAIGQMSLTNLLIMPTEHVIGMYLQLVPTSSIGNLFACQSMSCCYLNEATGLKTWQFEWIHVGVCSSNAWYTTLVVV